MPPASDNGVSLSCRRTGEGAPVLFIMGSNASGQAWTMHQTPALAKAGYESIVFDNRGVSPSDVPPGKYSVGDMVADTRGLIEALGLGPCRIVATSLGGIIAQELTIGHSVQGRPLLRPDSAGAHAFTATRYPAGYGYIEDTLGGGGGTFKWGTSAEPWTFSFSISPKVAGPTSFAYQVERMKFDQILLDNARAKGDKVREECAVADVISDGGRVCGIRYADASGRDHEVRARFVVDASGNKSSVYPHVGGDREYSQFFRNLALFGYFEVSSTLTSVGAVVRREAADGVQGEPEKALQDLIDECPLITEYLSGARRVTTGEYGRLRVRKDYSYHNTKFWRPEWLLSVTRRASWTRCSLRVCISPPIVPCRRCVVRWGGPGPAPVSGGAFPVAITGVFRCGGQACGRSRGQYEAAVHVLCRAPGHAGERGSVRNTFTP